jgi:hypothetical protein
MTIPHNWGERRAGLFARTLYYLRSGVERLINRLKQRWRLSMAPPWLHLISLSHLRQV